MQQLICKLLFLLTPILCTLNIVVVQLIISAQSRSAHGKHIPMKGVRYIQHVYAFMQHHQYTQSYHRCVSSISAKGHVRRHTVGRGHQPGLTPNMHIFGRLPLLQSSHMKIVPLPLERPCHQLACCVASSSINPSVFLLLGG